MEYAVPQAPLDVLERLTLAGHEAYLVGGCVRDLLRGAKPDDWDICTSARPEQVMACFPDARLLTTGIRHGTVTILLGTAAYEVTAFRADGTYSDGRRPDQVRFVRSLEEDLARRDFTMNAIAMAADGTIHDPFGGRGDIAAGLVRCVGEPERRFREDGLRILRGLRFAAVLDFSIEPATAQALHRCAPRLGCVAAERIQTELKKLLTGQAAGRVLAAYGDILPHFWPELSVSAAQSQPWAAAIAALAEAPPDLAVRLALLLEGGGQTRPEDCGALLARLRFDRETIRRTTLLLRLREAELQPDETAIRHWLSRVDAGDFDRLLALQLALGGDRARLEQVRRLAGHLLARGDCVSLGQLAVNGRDALAAGISPGRAVGQALELLLRGVLNGTLQNSRECLLAELARMVSAPHSGTGKEFL